MRIELGETPLSENLPSISVIVPLVLPFTRTFTPMTGSPVWSTTVPVTVMFPVCCTIAISSLAITIMLLPGVKRDRTKQTLLTKEFTLCFSFFMFSFI